MLLAFVLWCQEANAGVRAVGQSESSIDLEYREAAGSVSNSRIVESSNRSVLVEVGDLDTLELEMLNESGKHQNVSAASTAHSIVEKSPQALVAFRGIYRGRRVALVRFYPDTNQDLVKSIRVRLTWFSGNTLGLSNGREEGGIWSRQQLIEKRSSGQVGIGSRAQVRIPITQDGIYELSGIQLKSLLGVEFDELSAEAIDLRSGGKRIPVESNLESSGRFSLDDTLLFYAYGNKTEYSRTNVVWLQMDSDAGIQMQTFDARAVEGLPIPESFPTTIHAEEDLHLWQTMPRGEGVDHWFWGDKLTAPDVRAFVIETPAPMLVNEQPLNIRVALHGLTFSSRIRPDHEARLDLNGVFLGKHTWDDRVPTVQSEFFSNELLRSGQNEIAIEAPGVSGVVVDQFFVNWVEIDYQRGYVAQANRLEFGSPFEGKQTFSIKGFDTEQIDIFDISDSEGTRRLENFRFKSERGQKVLQFSANATAASKFLVQEIGDRKQIIEMDLDIPSNLRRTNGGADYIVITHEEFEDAARRLASFRETQGLRSKVVFIRDVYDEFNHGVFHPRAIREFLKFAYHEWERPAPRYVVLLGDAYLDYRDNLRTGSINYVPSQQINTELLGLTVSDNWFAQVDGDDKIPDIFLGRIPVRVSSEANRIVDRIVRYETEATDETWTSRVAFVADDDRLEFQELSEELAQILPPSFEVTRWYSGERSDSVQRDGIVGLFEMGHGLISYTGHGTISSWGLTGKGEILLSGSIASKINPEGKWPIVTTANCLNGFFAARHSKPALAESLLASKAGGAIAVWAPTSLGFPEGHRILMKHFYKHVFERGIRRMGEATTGAQVSTFVQDSRWLELMETYVLFGDPAMTFGFTVPPPVPELTIGPVTDDVIELMFTTNPGFDYTILSKEGSLPGETWSPVPNGPHNSGLIRITLGAESVRFFKIEVRPSNLVISGEVAQE